MEKNLINVLTQSKLLEIVAKHGFYTRKSEMLPKMISCLLNYRPSYVLT